MYGQDIMCRISKVPFEILHKIFVCILYTSKIAQDQFWNGPQATSNTSSVHYEHCVLRGINDSINNASNPRRWQEIWCGRNTHINGSDESLEKQHSRNGACHITHSGIQRLWSWLLSTHRCMNKIAITALNIFKCISVKWNVCNMIQFSLQFVPRDSNDSETVLG